MKFRFDKMDANENAFFSRQLEHIRPEVLKVEYAQLKGRIFVPVNNNIHPGAEEYTYRVVDQVGSAKIISDYGTDIPSVDIHGKETTQKIRGIATSYIYSIQEARAAMMAQLDLQQGKAVAARDAVEQLMDKVLLVGGEVDGVTMKGLFDQTLADVTEYTVPDPGSGTDWPSKSPDEVVADMHGSVEKVVVDTKEIERPDTMILPTTRYNYVANTRMGDGSDQTILRFFLATNEYVSTVMSSSRLESAGAGSTKRGVTYRRDPSRLEALIPQEFEQMMPQFDGLVVKTPVHARTGGVILYRPKSLCYFDGI